MKLLVTLCSSEPCTEAITAFLPLARSRPNTEMAVMDFSKVMGKNSELRNQLYLKAAARSGVPMHFLGSEQLTELKEVLSAKDFPEGVLSSLIKSSPQKEVDYGWMRNIAYLMAAASGADAIQFFDLDTRPLKNYADILEVHTQLLTQRGLAAVSGMYLGPNPVTFEMFKSPKSRERFLTLISRYTGFDLLHPPVVGGALAVNRQFFEKYPFPMLPATTLSDDLFLTYLANLLEVKTQQSCQLVEHCHRFNPEHPCGLSAQWIEGYFPRLLRITALMQILADPTVEQSLVQAINGRAVSYLRGDEQRKKVVVQKEKDFVSDLTFVVKNDQLEKYGCNDAESYDLIAIVNRLEGEVNRVYEEIDRGVADYLFLLQNWPKVVQCVRSQLSSNWV
jgi:hypothetical protein